MLAGFAVPRPVLSAQTTIEGCRFDRSNDPPQSPDLATTTEKPGHPRSLGVESSRVVYEHSG
jgi:hypothetical protein